jgi:hypothetical protein
MSDLLTTIEEMNATEHLKEPHLSYVVASLQERKKVSLDILKRHENEIILIASSGFLIDSVFAGLNEKHINYIAKNAPRDYKKNILQTIRDPEMLQEVFEIAKAMDKDLGENVTQNQDRLKNIIQYIKDNHVVFEFN